MSAAFLGPFCTSSSSLSGSLRALSGPAVHGPSTGTANQSRGPSGLARVTFILSRKQPESLSTAATRNRTASPFPKIRLVSPRDGCAPPVRLPRSPRPSGPCWRGAGLGGTGVPRGPESEPVPFPGHTSPTALARWPLCSRTRGSQGCALWWQVPSRLGLHGPPLPGQAPGSMVMEGSGLPSSRGPWSSEGCGRHGPALATRRKEPRPGKAGVGVPVSRTRSGCGRLSTNRDALPCSHWEPLPGWTAGGRCHSRGSVSSLP